MQLRLARQLAETLMRKHGLFDGSPSAGGWRFAWGHGRRTLGSASVRTRRLPDGTAETTRTLRLSKHFAQHNGEPAVRETILHEIAHALVGPEQGHGPAWRTKCHELGIPATRLADADTPTAPPDTPEAQPPLVVICDRCEQVVARRFRRPSARVHRRMFCRACGEATAGRLRCVPVRAAGN